MACSVIKRKQTPIEEGSEMALDRSSTKKLKVEYPTNGDPVHVELSDRSPTRMSESSLKFARLSQEELKQIYGGRRQRHVIRKGSIEDSEESEEEEGLTEEELKQTEGYKSLKNCFRIIAQKQSL